MGLPLCTSNRPHPSKLQSKQDIGKMKLVLCILLSLVAVARSQHYGGLTDFQDGPVRQQLGEKKFGRTQETIHQYASDIHDSLNQFASDIGLTQLFEPWFELIEDAGEQLKAFSGHQGLDDFVTQTLQLGFAKAIAKAIFVGLLGLVIFTCLVLFS